MTIIVGPISNFAEGIPTPRKHLAVAQVQYCVFANAYCNVSNARILTGVWRVDARVSDIGGIQQPSIIWQTPVQLGSSAAPNKQKPNG
jgi:hypothetical protein